MSVATAQTGDDGLAVSARPYDALKTWLPFALIIAAAIAVRHFVGANTDVSWEITLSEKILDGQRLGRRRKRPHLRPANQGAET